jgi:16S rRNA (cytosine1402-N4)-methyltransferase
MDTSFHTPVLVEKVCEYLITEPDGVYVDGTLGGGGHAEEILLRCGPRCSIVGFDRDADALAHAGARLGRFAGRVRLVHSNFSALRDHLSRLGIARVNGILLDLGVSSRQIDDASRGFSFQQSARIDMRMDRAQSFDGSSVIHKYDVDRLTEIFRSYGEEKAARRIARRIVDVRDRQPLETTADLAAIIGAVVGKQFVQKSCARIFQAVRIEVNGEMENLKSALKQSLDTLGQGGRIVVISYHSLEDRIVKNFFRDEARTSIPSGHRLVPDEPRIPGLRLLTGKPVLAGDGEVALNPRARSAKLRAAERIGL